MHLSKEIVLYLSIFLISIFFKGKRKHPNYFRSEYPYIALLSLTSEQNYLLDFLKFYHLKKINHEAFHHSKKNTFHHMQNQLNMSKSG